MKIKSSLLSLLLCSGFFPALAQTGHLAVSEQLPKPGSALSITYDPSGTKLQASEQVTAVAWLFNQAGAPYALDLPLSKSGNTWTCRLAVPDSISLIAFKFNDGELVDDSQPKGYLVSLYTADGKPVKGGLLSRAMVYFSFGPNFMGMQSDPGEAILSIEKEYLMYPESRGKSMSLYNSLIMASKDSGKIAALKTASLQVFNRKDAKEEELNAAMNVLGSANKAILDSLSKLIVQRFPAGTRAAYNSYYAFATEKDFAKRVVLYEQAKAAFNPNIYEQTMLSSLAVASARAKDYEGFKKYSSMITDKNSLPGMLNNIAWPLAEKGESLDFAAFASKQSLDLLDAVKDNPASPGIIYPLSERIKNNRSNYMMYADTYALILYKQGKLAEALAYQEKAVGVGDNPEVNERYALFLAKNGKTEKAKAALEGYLRTGKSTAAMKQQLKEIYSSEKGSEAGYGAYLAGLEAAAKAKAREETVAKMINKPAPAFALKDFDGKTVSLASLKGKVVVIDFWATWCGPCKASFPGMQLAVTKFKNDPNVAFVFIDTWETDANYAALAKKFIADNNYTFHVLYDLDNAETKKHGKIVSDYGVDGIPTKFVIDKTGNIRFKSVGFSGNTDALADEIATMVGIAGKPAKELASAGK